MLAMSIPLHLIPELPLVQGRHNGADAFTDGGSR